MNILVTDDEYAIRNGISRYLSNFGFEVLQAETGLQAIQQVKLHSPGIVLLDLCLPDRTGNEVLTEIKRMRPDCTVIILTGSGRVQDAVNAMKLGADHYLTKPASMDELLLVVQKAAKIQNLRQEATFYRTRGRSSLVGSSQSMVALRHLIALVADRTETTVLIQGESGTGKELVAREIHAQGGDTRPFIDVNCAVLSAPLLESELFGHERGAFTDAKQQKVGLFELADGGVLFLDEIGEMEIGIQAKLLRVLQTRTFRRVGGTKDLVANVQVIAATNRTLSKMVKTGAFRDDLFYRLNVFPLVIPPLRERRDDIPLLTEYFVQALSHGRQRGAGAINDGVAKLLREHSWPGNVRELRNVLERALILCQDGEIRAEHLPTELGLRDMMELPSAELITLEMAEMRFIAGVLQHQLGNVSQTARILGISRSTLQQKIRKYNLTADL